jgi:hypothetical protein
LDHLQSLLPVRYQLNLGLNKILKPQHLQKQQQQWQQQNSFQGVGRIPAMSSLCAACAFLRGSRQLQVNLQ